MDKMTVLVGIWTEIHNTNEDGETCVWHKNVNTIGFSTEDGYEFMLLRSFCDSRNGLAQANHTAAKIQAALDAKGLDAIDETLWSSRIIYGSEAYQREEMFIVDREKSDALMIGY